ncbi:MAG: glycosyltransferase family 2 protein [Anaerolineaceae bacterium]
MNKVSIIIPAMNEELFVGNLVKNVHSVLEGQGLNHEIIVINDGSSDNTASVAESAGARIISHAYNMGNGAAVKTGIRNAQGDIIVMMDADGQHDPADILRLIDNIDKYGMVVGARTRESQTAWYRDFANSIYNMLASYVCDRNIPDLTSGFRAVHAPLARQFLYLLPNTFSYPTTITLAMLRAGHCINYIPIQALKRVGKSKIKLMRDGFRFLLIIFKITTLFSPLKVFLPISFLTFSLGVVWYLFNLITYGMHFPPVSVILIIAGLLFFLMGLISEQISQLRYDHSENYPLYPIYFSDSVPDDDALPKE